jgi:hypothetical protein
LIIKTLTETMQAKLTHRAKSPILCYIDWIWAILKAYVRIRILNR